MPPSRFPSSMPLPRSLHLHPTPIRALSQGQTSLSKYRCSCAAYVGISQGISHTRLIVSSRIPVRSTSDRTTPSYPSTCSSYKTQPWIPPSHLFNKIQLAPAGALHLSALPHLSATATAHWKAPQFPKHQHPARSFSSSSKMAQEYKLTGINSLSDLKSSTDKIEVEVEGVQDGKVLLVNLDGNVHALSPRCTHYGAPLKNGVVAPDGRITCPWHGACFNVSTGDVEDAPALKALHKYDVFEKEGGVYIRAAEADIKSGQRNPVLKCSISNSDEKVVIVGGGSGTIGVAQALRELKYPGQITIISTEPSYVIDRPKLSKALIPDASKLLFHPEEWYAESGIETLVDEVKAVDFSSKILSTGSGKSISYTKLVLATGGTPRTLPLPGFKNELQNIFTLRNVADVQAILDAAGDSKKNVVVIGSSFIGMEAGNALAGKEHAVTIVGMESAPLERVMGAEVGRIFQKNLEKNGVAFKLAAGVEKATPKENSSDVGAVHLQDGTVLPADLVILGVGVRPATDFLKDNQTVELLKDGSLATDEHFVVPGVDSVFAVGDIATYPYHGPGGNGSPVRIEHWNVAQNAGRTVARAIVHERRAPLSSLSAKTFIPIFWSALGAQMRYCGNTVNGYDDLILQGEPENGKFTAYYTKGDVVVAVATMGMDPIMVQSAELMRRGKMPGKKDIVGGLDVLQVK